MRGMQCPKMLWLDKHKPSLKVIPPEVQQCLDAGNDFGDRAMGMFGSYEEMTVYRPGTHIPDKKKMVAKTQEHLLAGTPVICEAAFIYYNMMNGDAIRIKAGKSTPYQWDPQKLSTNMVKQLTPGGQCLQIQHFLENQLTPLPRMLAKTARNALFYTSPAHHNSGKNDSGNQVHV